MQTSEVLHDSATFSGKLTSLSPAESPGAIAGPRAESTTRLLRDDTNWQTVFEIATDYSMRSCQANEQQGLW